MTNLVATDLFADSPFSKVNWGSLVVEREEKTVDDSFEPLSVGQMGVTPQLESVARPKDPTGRKIVRKGDIVINSRSDRRGASGVSGLEGAVSVVYSVMSPKTDALDPRFAGHLLKSDMFQDTFYLAGVGIVDDLWTTNFNRMSSIRVPLPPLRIQRAIADYLDRETAEIDAMTADLDELEKLLAERRSALITAATRSLSGKTVRLGWKMNLVNGYPFDSGLFSMDPLDTHLPLVRIRDITATEFETFVPASEVPDSFVVRDGDLVIGMDGDFNTVIWSRGPAALNQRVCLLRSSNRLLARYAKYFIDGQLDRINELTYATTVKHLSSGQVRNLVIPDIPEDEMLKFVETVDRETAEIDAMLADITELRDLLAERRAALIAAAVTGQIDIPTAEEPTRA